MYNSPTCPKRVKALVRSITPNPRGPIIAPAIISPIRWGIRNLLRTIGAKRIINRMMENIRTGLFSGSEKSVILRNVKGI
jgi:hypothetical protein